MVFDSFELDTAEKKASVLKSSVCENSTWNNAQKRMIQTAFFFIVF